MHIRRLKYLLLWPLVAMSTTPAFAQKKEHDLRIVFFSNMPEIEASDDRPGLARVSAYIKKVRAENLNSLVIHGGDSLSPSVLSSLDRGAHMIDILNSVEPDVFAVAKREFAYGEDVLIQRAEEALFPFVTSNTRDMATDMPFDAIPPSELFDVGDVKIGFLALTSPQLVEEYATRRTTLTDAIESANDQATLLRDAGADLLVLSADFDLTNFPGLFEGDVFDIIVQSSTKKANARKIGRTYYLMELGNASSLTDIRVTVTEVDGRHVIADLSVENPDLFLIEGDQGINEMISQHTQPLSRLLDTPLGRTGVRLSTIRSEVRSGENAFANMLADSVRLATNADIALINGGSIRGDTVYEANSYLTRNHLQAEMPFRNTIALLEVTGQQVWDALEHGIPCKKEFDGCYPHVSNLEIVYSTSKQSLISVSVGGQSIERDRTYKLATTDFLAIGGDGYGMLKQTSRLKSVNTGQLTREILSKYILDNETVTPSIEGRIIFQN